MRVIRVFIFGLVFFLPSYSLADPAWLDQDLMVEDVVVYSRYGKNVVTLRVSSSEELNLGCAPTDTHHIFSYWSKADFNGVLRSQISTLLSAQAQQLPIRILADVGNCNTSGWDGYGAPLGLGVAFYGVRVVRE